MYTLIKVGSDFIAMKQPGNISPQILASRNCRCRTSVPKTNFAQELEVKLLQVGLHMV